MVSPLDPPPLSLDKKLIQGRYALNPPLPAADVEAFEERYNITLPTDYKYFITQIGNGGGAPHHLFPLGEWAFDETFHKIDEPDWKIVGDVGQPFPHTEDWIFPDSLGIAAPEPAIGTPPEEVERLRDEWEENLEEEYLANGALMNGALPICHLGCGDSQWLVVNGPQKGYVWNCYGLDIVQLRDAEGRPMTFTDWYLNKLQAPQDQRIGELHRLLRASYDTRTIRGRRVRDWAYVLAACVGGSMGLVVAPVMGLRNPRADLILAAAGAAGMCLLAAALDRWIVKRRECNTTGADKGS
ncbi:MAG TPA: SMI1/KNR4 family protein [Planctomycetaceae bacterium]|jgi:hypothetical protein|nr:SMI1/KNR4 family protein [Planctomycetaceae bacterium]